MISTKELCVWERKAKSARTAAIAKMKKEHSPQLYSYLGHIATCADAQLAIIQRLIMQSKENDKEQICQQLN